MTDFSTENMNQSINQSISVENYLTHPPLLMAFFISNQTAGPEGQTSGTELVQQNI